MQTLHSKAKRREHCLRRDALLDFQETLDLKDEVKRWYNVPIHVYRPSGVNIPQEFEALYGERLWETNDAVYDYWVKVCFNFSPAPYHVLRAFPTPPSQPQ
jgi:3'-phosphoadenosine 5'-phosphosulfate sulfotransferase (PAPS reductase)/FAD synthetase